MISGGKENVFKRNYIPLGKFKQDIKQIEPGGKIKRTI